MVRSPEKLDIKHDRLRVVKGNVMQPETFTQYMQGRDAVLSVLGATERGPTTIYSEGTANIVKGMKSAGIKRLMAVTSETVGAKDAEGLNWFMRFLLSKVLFNLLKNAYNDMIRMEAYLQTIDLDWTIVRPAKLNNKPVTGKYDIELNRNYIKGYNTSRADLAHYMLSILDDSRTFKGIAIITQ